MRASSSRSSLVGVLSLLCLLFSYPALAHKVSVFAYVEDGKVFVEGYFADGKKPMDSEVSVFADGAETPVFEGRTDDQGMLSFPLPKVDSALRVVLNAGMGHRGEYTIPKAEVVGAAEMPAASSSVLTPSSPDNLSTPAAAIDKAELESIVNHAVAEAIKPLVRELAASQEHVSFTQKVGGVGYIFGVMGILAFLLARKKEEKAKKEGNGGAE